MKSKISITLLLSLPILALARPDLYKESEDFKFSRTSSDDGSKTGFYESQRGNMGGNYEKSYNMDNLAQNQLNDLSTRVGSNPQVSTNLRTGSTFGLASTSGTEYGASLKGRTASGSLNSNVGSSGLAQNGYEGSSGSNYQSSQSSNLNRYSTYNRNAANGATLQSGSGYDLHGAAGTNLELQQGHQQHLAPTGQRYYYDSATGQYILQSAQGQSSFGATSSQAVQGAQLSSLDRPLIVHPVKIKLVPGSIVTLPVSAQVTNHDSMGQHSSMQSQNQLSSNSNRQYAMAGYGDNHNYDDTQYSYQQPTTRPKSYQSSYNYRKQWESHGTAPVVGNVGPQVTIPVVVPTGTVVSGDSLQSANTRLNTGAGSVRYSSGSRVASAGQQHGATQYSNRNSYAAGDNSQLELDALASTNVNQASNTAHLNSLSSATGDQQSYSGLDQAASGDLAYTSKPKNYQSSYSYHKAWERHGTPYVIKPAISADGSIDLNSNQGLDAAAQLLQNQQSASMSKSSYRSQSSASGSSGASNSGYQQGGNLCDINCYNAYLHNNENNLGHENYRSKRSYNSYRHLNSHKYHPVDDSEEETDLGQQQLQSFNQEIDDGGQKVEDFGQQIDTNFGQNAEDFGQANIPVESNHRNLLYTGIYENTTPKNLINKPDIQYSFLLSNPSIYQTSFQESTTDKNDYNLMHSQMHNHRTWSQQTVPQYHSQFVQNQNEDMRKHFIEFDKIAKEIADSLKFIPDHTHTPKSNQVNIDVTYNPALYHYPDHRFSHHTTFNGEYGHDRHIQDKHLFLHKHSQLDTECKKHEQLPSSSASEDDVLKRIDELQKQLGFGLFNIDKPQTPQPHNNFPTTTPAVSQTRIANVNRVKTPEEIEALSLIRNSENPVKPPNLDQSLVNSLSSVDNQPKDTFNTYPKENIHLTTKENKNLEGYLNYGEQTQNFDKKQHNVDQETQAVEQEIEHTEQKTQNEDDLGQQTEDFGQKVEDVGQETQDFWPQKEDVGQQLQDFGQQQQNIHQIPKDDLELQVGIVRQQLQVPKDSNQKDENRNFIYQEQINENKEISNNKPHSQQPVNSINYSHQNNLNYQNKENIHKEASEEKSQDLGQESMDFGQSQMDFGQSQMDFGQSQIDFGQNQVNIGKSELSQNKDIDQIQKEDSEEKSQDLGQQSMDFGQSQMDFGQSQMDFGQSQVDFGQSQIDIGQSELTFGQSQNKETVQIRTEQPKVDSHDLGQESIHLGQTQMDIGQSQLGIGIDIRSNQKDHDQSPMDFGQSEMDVGQSPMGFDQSQVDFGQSQIQVDDGRTSDDVLQTQLNLGQQVEGFGHSSSGGLQLKYGYNEPNHQQRTPTQQSIGEQARQEAADVEKYKNLEIDESGAPEEVATTKPGFFKNLGNKIGTGFNKVFG